MHTECRTWFRVIGQEGFVTDGGSSDVNVRRREGKFGKRGGGGRRRRCRVEYQPTRFSRTCTASSASSELVRACETTFFLHRFFLSLSLSLSLRTQKIYGNHRRSKVNRETIDRLLRRRKEPVPVSVRLHRFFELWVRERNRYQWPSTYRRLKVRDWPLAGSRIDGNDGEPGLLLCRK